MVILLGIMVAGCGAESAVTASATSSATHPPSATPKPAIKENTAVLGGAVYAFDKKFGSNNCCYENGWDYQGPAGQMWTGVDYEGAPGNNVDETSTARVKTIRIALIQDSDASWSVSQADAICNPYLPPDAQYKGTTTVKDVTGLAVGTEKQYTSALLANTLPASDFKDVNGHAVTPGTLYMYYAGPYHAGLPDMVVQSCTLSADETAAQSL